MKTVQCLGVCLFIAFLQICRVQCNLNLPPQRSYESNLAVAGTNPYQVAILRRLSFNFDVIDGKKFVCGGSLINNQWVLTAAQCVSNPNLRVVLGMSNIRVYESHHQSFDITVNDIFVHPEYNVETMENDIALIMLPNPVDFNIYIQPVTLDTLNENHVNETVFLSGWGRVSAFTPVADYLRQTTLKVINNHNCQQSFLNPFFHIGCLHLCATDGLLYNEIGPCAGDTGAPLIYFNTLCSRPEQIGILTKPPFTCNGMEPMVFTRVSQYEYWINNVIELNQNASMPAINNLPCNSNSAAAVSAVLDDFYPTTDEPEFDGSDITDEPEFDDSDITDEPEFDGSEIISFAETE